MIIGWIRQRPWIWVIVAFVILILSWVVLYELALKAKVIRIEPGEPLPEGVVPGSGHPSAQDSNSGEGEE